MTRFSWLPSLYKTGFHSRSIPLYFFKVFRVFYRADLIHNEPERDYGAAVLRTGRSRYVGLVNGHGNAQISRQPLIIRHTEDKLFKSFLC